MLEYPVWVMLRVDHQQTFGGDESNNGIQAPVKWQGVVSEKPVVRGIGSCQQPKETNWSLTLSAAVSFSGQKPEESSSVSLDHT